MKYSLWIFGLQHFSIDAKKRETYRIVRNTNVGSIYGIIEQLKGSKKSSYSSVMLQDEITVYKLIKKSGINTVTLVDTAE